MYHYIIPVYRVEINSKLTRLGDLNDDGKWTQLDLDLAKKCLDDPWLVGNNIINKLDLNQNGQIELDDLHILEQLVQANGDPYEARRIALTKAMSFPQPRELFLFHNANEHISTPRIKYDLNLSFPFEMKWMQKIKTTQSIETYDDQLRSDLWDEAIRLLRAYHRRKDKLNTIEFEHFKFKLALAKTQWSEGKKYETLITLMALVEDAETISIQESAKFSLQILKFRDHLREILTSAEFEKFKSDNDYKLIFQKIESYLTSDLGMNGYSITNLPSPRNFTNLENYLERAEWQYYKNSVTNDHFLQLISFAQNDRRYRRAVSQTTPKHQDLLVSNHNLAMTLLYREAFRIMGGNPRRAVGLLDETLRIPFGWIKSLPREILPGALGLENFLLPGNKEDGSDKSRHWNVFGGISFYKSPQEAVALALKREVKDMREGGFTADVVEENLRDLIADLNGIFHILTISPGSFTKE